MQITQRDLGNITCLEIQGRIVLEDGADLLRDRVNNLLSLGKRHLLLNMKAVTYMDTSGLAAMLGVKMSAEREGGTVRLLHLPERMHNLLVITWLITAFDRYESEAEAVLGSDAAPAARPVAG